MARRGVKCRRSRSLASSVFLSLLVAATPIVAARFTDDFSSGLSRWTLSAASGIRTIDSADPSHGAVMVLSPNGDVHAVIKGSEKWGSVRIEGDVRFPEKADSYLGVMYNVQQHGERLDFGLIYIKGDGSYLQANPHRDYNVTRTFYPEARASLTGASAITIGKWQHFKVEVVGRDAHFYVGDMTTPRLTFQLADLTSGAVGLQPRSVGGDVWADNVTVTSIDRLSYEGPPVPSPRYARDSLLTKWQVAGPLPRTSDDIARTPARHAYEWRSLETDERGAVSTASVIDFHGARTVAYFRTIVTRRDSGAAVLHVSSVDDLALWVNGRFAWFIPRTDAAWYDIATNATHAGRRIPIDLRAGTNDIVVRVRGGTYAAGGFFARVEAVER